MILQLKLSILTLLTNYIIKYFCKEYFVSKNTKAVHAWHDARDRIYPLHQHAKYYFGQTLNYVGFMFQ